MSTILDALRKAQSEKVTTGKQSSPAEPLLTSRAASTSPISNRRALIIGGCGLVLLAITGWLLYGPTIKQTETTVARLQQPALPVAPQQTAAPAAATTQQPATVQPPAPAPPATVPTAPTTATVQANQEEDHEERAVSRRKQQKAAVTSPAAVIPEAAQGRVVQPGTPEGIKLTGIAWQESRKMRRAVVNEILAGEGTVIAGAQIVEIRPQAVRFEKNGVLYEVTLAR